MAGNSSSQKMNPGGPGRSESKSDLLIFLGLVLLSLVVFWQGGLDLQPMTPDKSMQIYIAQEITRGHPPYVAVIFPKTPLAPLLSALAITAGNWLGLMDVLAVRGLFLLLGSLGVASTFMVAKYISSDPMLRLAPPLTLLGFRLWETHTITGAEPRILLMLLGLLSLWALAEERWFLAGLTSSLAFLTWQPAGFYVVLALATPLWITRKAREFIRALAGASLPLALLAIYLLANQAFLPALRQTVGGQFAYLLESGSWDLGRGLAQLSTVTINYLSRPGAEVGFVILGSIGWLGFTAKSLLSRNFRAKPAAINPFPLLLSGYGWLVFSLRDLDGPVDLLPLLPYLALGLGSLLGEVLDSVKKKVAARTLVVAQGLVLLSILGYGLQELALQRGIPSFTLQEQMERATILDAYLGEEGEVQAIGDLSLLVLSERRNLTPVIHLGPKHYNILLSEPGGLEQPLATIAARRPKVLILQRVWYYSWAQPFFEMAVGKIPHPLLANFEDQIQLLGYDLTTSQGRPGGQLDLTLYLAATPKIKDKYTVTFNLQGIDGETYSSAEFNFPGGDKRLWLIGAPIQRTFTLPLSSQFPGPAAAQIELAFIQKPQEEQLPILSIEGEEAGESLVLPAFRISGEAAPTPENALSFQVGDSFRLIGYSLSGSTEPGGELAVTLFWQSRQATDTDYQVFVHLVDGQGQVWAQGDSAPRTGSYPTSFWLPGEIIEDTHRISLPPELPSGDYRVRMGIYLLDTGERLPVTDEHGERVAEDAVIIEALEVE